MTNANEIKKSFNEQVVTVMENLIDKALPETCMKYNNRVEIVIKGEYSKENRDIVADKYMKEGEWSKVTHQTSSENGERPGLTGFNFYY